METDGEAMFTLITSWAHMLDYDARLRQYTEFDSAAFLALL